MQPHLRLKTKRRNPFAALGKNRHKPSEPRKELLECVLMQLHPRLERKPRNPCAAMQESPEGRIRTEEQTLQMSKTHYLEWNLKKSASASNDEKWPFRNKNVQKSKAKELQKRTYATSSQAGNETQESVCRTAKKIGTRLHKSDACDLDGRLPKISHGMLINKLLALRNIHKHY